MTTDVDALLAYGYDLGGPGRWNLHGVAAQDLGPNFPWWDATDADGIACVANGMLLEARRARAGFNVVGVKVLWYGSEMKWTGTGVGYLLAATYYSTYFSHAMPITALDIMREPDANQRLQCALDVLGIRPLFEPRWHLAASHGI